MNITECVPLAGRGLVARRGHLVALTGGTDAGPDPLLTALTAVAYANGDGAALALAATRAAAEHGGRPAWACAGVTFGEQVAVLVYGEAVALVSVDGSPQARVTASDSMIPVAGTFTGAVVTVRQRARDFGGCGPSLGQQPVAGIGEQARALNVQPVGGKSDGLWSLIYQGKGFVGTVTVAGPNASKKAVTELGQQAYAYANKTLS